MVELFESSSLDTSKSEVFVTFKNIELSIGVLEVVEVFCVELFVVFVGGAVLSGGPGRRVKQTREIRK